MGLIWKSRSVYWLLPSAMLQVSAPSIHTSPANTYISDFFQSSTLMDIKAIHIDKYVNDWASNRYLLENPFFIVYLHIRE